MKMTSALRPRCRRADRLRPLAVLICALFAANLQPPEPAPAVKAAGFRKDIQPLITKYCSDCHADGATKGNVAFDQAPSDDALIADAELWWKVLKNVRAGVMPPAKKPQPTPEEKLVLANWVKYAAFG